MPLNTRDLAAQTLLLMAAATLLVMGCAGLIGWVMFPGILGGPMLVPDASIVTVLIGSALVATLFHAPVVRLASATLLSILLIYTLLHNQADNGVSASLITGESRMTSLSAVMLLLINLCCWLGIASSRSRVVWLTVGLGLWLFGGVVIVLMWQASVTYRPPFSSSPLAALVFVFLTGTALLVASWREHTKRLSPGKHTVIVALGGVVISCLAWLLLSINQRNDIEQQAGYLLDSVQLNAEQVMTARLQLMQRMANRLDVVPAEQGLVLHESDARRYFLDTPSLQAIALVNAQSEAVWSQGRSNDGDAWLLEQLNQSLVQSWLAVPFSRPRLFQPDETQDSVVVMVVPIASREQQLLAAFDLRTLLGNELRLGLGPFQVGINRGADTLMVLHPAGFSANETLEPAQAIVSRHVGLPGGINVTLHAYPGEHHNWYIVGVIPVGVALGGLLLSWLLAFSVGVVIVSMSRTKELSLARESLEQSEQHYRSLFIHHPDAVFSLNAEGQFVTANNSCGAITGYTNAEIIGQHFTHFIEVADVERVGEYFKHVVTGNSARFELTLKDRDGQAHLLDLVALPISINGSFVGVHCIAQDVTASREQQVRLRILERSVEASVNGVLIADASQPDTPIVYANKAFARMTGYSQEEVIGRNCRFLQGPDSDPDVVAQLRRGIQEQRETHVTICNYRQDGTPFWNELYISPVRDQEGHVTHFVGIQHDISQQKASEARLSYYASHDDLTRLPNRMLFEETLCKQFALANTHHQRISVLFVDLDDFKPINDSLGHAVGDQVLVEVAQRLRDTLRQEDTVARLGGDEFVLLLTNTPHEAQAEEVVERLLLALAKPYCIEGRELHLSASVGIAMSQPDTPQPHTLIQQADIAMYRAKQQGRNAYAWFHHNGNDIASERVTLRNDLQDAIERQAFELYYQPIFNRDGQIASVEALLRWPHPIQGYISPERFIPLAEATGQIMPISEWVLKRACRDMQQLHDKGLGAICVAVNLSPLQFHRASFLETLCATLKSTGMPPAQLTLELTEGILMDNTANAIDTLHSVRSMGIRVSIDDFGTGFSSLSYLKHLPISAVKIDRSFINELTHRNDDAAIVQGIISMAHHLGLSVVAEGVETDAQYQRLLTYQCDFFQGFGLAKPMPLSALEDLITVHAVSSTDMP
ncbi:EAL domain-containing protein [Halomonas sp. 7T]|uniref:EAL domain-containing protein n=1 Tax=Halomonas sp. 7T TaxID=2893469 RepID=UPI0021D81460|nr:EAL domain-containing protein [Halomonas sp. 7T]UXZ53666.1 EAL domain-containing protein [Halomonas sp. 7T]